MRRVLAAVVLAVAPAPRPAAAVEGVKNPDTFVYAITGEVDSLDPAWAFDSVSQAVHYQLYETLIFFRGSAIGDYDPLLATAVPTRQNGFLSADGLQYAFPIRKGVVFHDGTPLTLEDVKYSILRFMLLDRAGGPSHLLLEPIVGARTTLGENGRPDPDVYDAADDAVQIEAGAVVIRLKQPYPALLSILAGFCPIVSKSWVVARGGWDGRKETWAQHHDPPKQATPLYREANGTGPFKLVRWDQQTRQVLLERNGQYWREPARLRYAVFKTVDDPGARKLMLQAGDADAIMLERQNLPQVEGMPGTTITDNLPFLETHNSFLFNFRINAVGNPYVGSSKLDGRGIPSDFFTDLDLRKAFAYSFDTDAYVRDGYRSKAQQARGPIPYGVFGYNPRQPAYSHDPQRAEESFRRAWGGKVWDAGFTFTLTYMEGAADRQLACQILKAGVEALNPRFHVDVRGVQWSTWLDQLAQGKIAMANARWHLDYADPHDAVFPFLHSEGYYAKALGYSNPRADRFIEAAQHEGDRDRRRNLYYELQAVAYADAPAIFTVDTFYFEVNRSWVKGWYYNPLLMYGYLYPVYKEEPAAP